MTHFHFCKSNSLYTHGTFCDKKHFLNPESLTVTQMENSAVIDIVSNGKEGSGVEDAGKTDAMFEFRRVEWKRMRLGKTPKRRTMRVVCKGGDRSVRQWSVGNLRRAEHRSIQAWSLPIMLRKSVRLQGRLYALYKYCYSVLFSIFYYIDYSLFQESR